MSIYYFLLLIISVSCQELLGRSSPREKRQACICRPKSQCGALRGTRECDLPGGGKGFCCRNIRAAAKRISIPLSEESEVLSLSRLPSGVSDTDIKNILSTKNKRQQSSFNDDEVKGHRHFTHAREEDQDLMEFAKSILHVNQNIGISAREAGGSLDATNSEAIRRMCPWLNDRRPQCETNKNVDIYRTMDGSCNNKAEPLFGLSGTPMRRILNPEYGTIGNLTLLPRLAKGGSQLPSARKLSREAFTIGTAANTDEISVYFMQMGQFIDHDMTHSPAAVVDCCLPDRQGRPWVFPNDPYNGDPDNCVAIEIPEDDDFWGRRGRRCMQLSRSELTPPIPNCAAGRREQMTALTHWIDGSNIYGNTDTEACNVRDRTDRSRLQTSNTVKSKERDLLPRCLEQGPPTIKACSKGNTNSHIEGCEDICEEPDRKCTFAGDLRSSEQPGLTTMHTVWLREHNRVAGELKKINKKWNDETVFQEARKIVIAEWQHIIYNEWLPITLGFEYMTTFNLLPLTSGYTLDYDETIDPRINNEFAANAFRFGHSLIPSHVPENDPRGKNVSRRDLKNFFNNPSIVNQGFIDNTIRGNTQEKVPAWDPTFTEDIVNHLFERSPGEGGLDLTAINIQRARDHGVPGYNNYRRTCASPASGFKAARNFDDLTKGNFLSRNDVRKLKGLYKHVDDIDLFVGGTFETPHRDSILGPTFKCIIGDQFTRLKRGDRFWYENGKFKKSRFSLKQLDEIRKSNMARILCDNSDIKQIQPLVFKIATGGNNLIQCKDQTSIPKLNLKVFKA